MSSSVTCGVCGAANPADYTFCFHCRHVPDGAEAPVKAARPKKKTAATASAKKTPAKKSAARRVKKDPAGA